MVFPSMWFHRLVGRFRPGAAADPLLAFDSELDSAPNVSDTPTRRDIPKRWIAAATVLVLVAAGMGASRWPAVTSRLGGLKTTPAPSVLSVTTRPEGAEVILDTVSRGATPVTLE